MSTVLVINSGSSSIKYQLVDPESGVALGSGLVERIGESVSDIMHKVGEQAFSAHIAAPNHAAGLKIVLDYFEKYGPSIQDNDCIAAGHRVVQGGALFPRPAVVDQKVLEQIKSLGELAPLHNPANAEGIEVAMKLLPNIPHIAVFDSSFFVDTLEPAAYTYALAKEVAEQYQIRRYGAHGTSHKFVGDRVAEFLDVPRESLKQIVLHIGNGASISAQSGSKAVDTSMGLTPLEGLVMGTRTGDIDPAAVFHLGRVAKMSFAEIDTLFNKKSGMLGLCGESDLRSVHQLIAQGDQDAELALAVYVRRLAKYIGSYYIVLGGCDTITFTAGVGENDSTIRAQVCEFLAPLGVKLDSTANTTRSSEPRVISAADSSIKVLVVPTNEELAIARFASKLARA